MTVKDLFQRTVRTLQREGFSSPTREARCLLARLLSISPSRVYLFWDREMDEETERTLEGLLARRLEGVPLQYVLGEWEFFSLPFKIEPGIFIPRLDTEAWLEEAMVLLRFLQGKREQVLVCDVCCGSGVIGLSCAFFLPRILVYGVDISEKAVRLAWENATILGLQEQVRFFCGDLFAPFEHLSLQFDVILANPPYIPEGEWEKLDKGIRLFEPREALLGGSDGLSVIRRIVEEGKSFLREGGFLFVEHDPSQEEALRVLAEKQGFVYVRSLKDYTHNVRASVLQKGREPDADSCGM
ncbi:MAG: peptide chain release factor N(5)-glutamine methyltransferase [Candidatus Caldatribacteriaceae bacterium]